MFGPHLRHSVVRLTPNKSLEWTSIRWSRYAQQFISHSCTSYLRFRG
jgi:hypothetical protein